MNASKLLIAGLLVLLTTALAEAAPPKMSASTRLKIRQKYYVPPPEIIGRTNDGYYERGGDRIYLVATEFRGEFTHSAAQRTFFAAQESLVRKNQTVVFGRYNRRLAADRHVVYGWYNATRDEYGYVAFRIFSDGKSGQLLNHDGSTRTINDWYYANWTTNGFKVTVQLCDDGRGGVAAIFHTIK